MKKSFWILLFLLGLLLMTACAASQEAFPRASAASEGIAPPEPDPPQEWEWLAGENAPGYYLKQYSGIPDLNDLVALTRTYVHPLNPTGSTLLHSWPSAEEIPATDLIDFCAFNNLLEKKIISGEGDYEDNDGTAEAVEAEIRNYFDVSPDYLRTSDRYGGNGKKDQYLILGLGGGGGVARATAAKMEGELLTLTVRVYWPYPPEMTGTLVIKPEGDGFRYVSYEVHESENVDISDRDEFIDDYIGKLFDAAMLFDPWESPSEIAPEKFSAFYTLLMMQGNVTDTYPTDGDGDALVPAQAFEEEIACFFDVPAARLRASPYYDAEKNIYATVGLGGASSYRVTKAVQNGKILQFDFEVISDDGEVVRSGAVTLQITDEADQTTIRYASCKLLTSK